MMADENTDKTVEIPQKRIIGRPFEKGNNANPKGRPKGSLNYITLLEKSSKEIGTKKGKKLFDRLVERAFVNDKVLIALMKKFIPDKAQSEVKVTLK